jgi:hypothetical protein
MTIDCSIDEKTFRLMHPDTIKEVINRNNLELPDTFVPSANRIALVSAHLLLLVKPPWVYPPVGRWSGGLRKGWFRWFRADGGYILAVRRYGKLWSIQRQKLGETCEVLAFEFGPTPILLQDHEYARRIARQCHPSPCKEARCSWIPIAASIQRTDELYLL